MLSLNSEHRYLLYRQACDMRKSFNALIGLVQNELGHNPISGEVFIFINKRRTHMKLLHWEAGGFVLYYKRLEQGTFAPPMDDDATISWAALVLLFEGIEIKISRQKLRFSTLKKANKNTKKEAVQVAETLYF